MKVVILAGGYGTRISEESELRPKPMIEIGGKPILWHIMKEYSYYGFNDFIICAGYKQDIIKEYFANYYMHNSDLTFDFTANNEITVHSNVSEPWKVTVIDTGLSTMTGGRIKRIQKYVGNEDFMLTYGDGVSDIDMNELLKFHKSQGKFATITAVALAQRFGVLDIGSKSEVRSFREKNEMDNDRINGGYMVLKPEIFDYLNGDSTVFEQEPMKRLAEQSQLMAYQFDGFWQCMDTKREKDLLEAMISQGKAPWMKWERR